MVYEWIPIGIGCLYGLIIGSFLNVCIYRIPRGETIVTVPSHCMNCGYHLKWYDLIPVVSYLFLKGHCRQCKEKISLQYPLIELLNGVLYGWVLSVCGVSVESVLFCLATSALLVLSVIDFRTYEIPFGINVFLGILGLVHLLMDLSHLRNYIIGLVSVSGFLFLLFLLTKGRGIGGGDIKLMAACGLLLGYQGIILAFVIGCIAGSFLHMLRMVLSKEGHELAFGPYLSLGIFLAMLYGEQMWNWYFQFYS